MPRHVPALLARGSRTARRDSAAGTPRRRRKPRRNDLRSSWTGKSNAVPQLGHLCPRISTRASVEMKAVLFVEPPRAPIFLQHPQCHLGESATPKFREHMIDQHAAVATATEMGQDMQRRDVANPARVIIGVFRRNHLTKRDAVALFFNQKDRPLTVGDALRPEPRAIREIG